MNRLALNTKIALLVALPLVSFLAWSTFLVGNQYRLFQEAEELQVTTEVMRLKVAALPGLLDEAAAAKRFVIIEEDEDREAYEQQQVATDAALAKHRELLPKQLTEPALAQLRKQVVDEVDLEVSAEYYTRLEEMVVSLNSAVDPSSFLSSRFASLMSLLLAEIGFRKVLDQVIPLAANELPVEKTDLDQLISQKERAITLLAARSLSLPEESVQKRAALFNSEGYQLMESEFKKFSALAEEGDFGNLETGFKTAELAVQKQMEELIYSYIDSTQQEIRTVHSQALERLVIYLGVVIANLLAITTLAQIFFKRTRSNFNQVTAQVSEVCSEINQVSENLSTSSQRLTDASQVTQESVHESAAAIEEIRAMLGQTDNTVEQATEVSNQAMNSVDSGEQAMQELTAAMAKIGELVGELEQIKQSSTIIGKKTAVINEIVFKTQLLSINASIEAEKAGDFGRGFAVVADEVAKLADTSGKAAEEINDIIEQNVAMAEKAVREGESRVEKGNATTKAVSKVFEAVSRDLQKVNGYVGEIKRASTEQLAGIVQMADTMTAIDQRSQATMQEAQSASGLSESLAESTEKLQSTSENITTVIQGGSRAA